MEPLEALWAQEWYILAAAYGGGQKQKGQSEGAIITERRDEVGLEQVVAVEVKVGRSAWELLAHF